MAVTSLFVVCIWILVKLTCFILTLILTLPGDTVHMYAAWATLQLNINNKLRPHLAVQSSSKSQHTPLFRVQSINGNMLIYMTKHCVNCDVQFYFCMTQMLMRDGEGYAWLYVTTQKRLKCNGLLTSEEHLRSLLDERHVVKCLKE